MRTLMVLMFVAVLVALASAGVFMLRKGRSQEPGAAPGKQMARALAVRVGLSIALFLFILLSWRMGWVRPTGFQAGS